MRRAAPILALLMACSLAAYAAVPADCWALRKHGHAAEAQACFDGLTQSGDAYNRAEGFWGLEEWEQANAAVSHCLKRSRRVRRVWRVRWGCCCTSASTTPMRPTSSRKLWQKDPSNAEAYLGLALVSADGFDGKADGLLQQGHRARSQAGRSA